MRHTDDIVPIANNDNLWMPFNTVNTKSLEYGMEIDIGKKRDKK